MGVLIQRFRQRCPRLELIAAEDVKLCPAPPQRTISKEPRNGSSQVVGGRGSAPRLDRAHQVRVAARRFARQSSAHPRSRSGSGSHGRVPVLRLRRVSTESAERNSALSSATSKVGSTCPSSSSSAPRRRETRRWPTRLPGVRYALIRMMSANGLPNSFLPTP